MLEVPQSTSSTRHGEEHPAPLGCTSTLCVMPPCQGMALRPRGTSGTTSKPRGCHPITSTGKEQPGGLSRGTAPSPGLEPWRCFVDLGQGPKPEGPGDTHPAEPAPTSHPAQLLKPSMAGNEPRGKIWRTITSQRLPISPDLLPFLHSVQESQLHLQRCQLSPDLLRAEDRVHPGGPPGVG